MHKGKGHWESKDTQETSLGVQENTPRDFIHRADKNRQKERQVDQNADLSLYLNKLFQLPVPQFP